MRNAIGPPTPVSVGISEGEVAHNGCDDDHRPIGGAPGRGLNSAALLPVANVGTVNGRGGLMG